MVVSLCLLLCLLICSTSTMEGSRLAYSRSELIHTQQPACRLPGQLAWIFQSLEIVNSQHTPHSHRTHRGCRAGTNLRRGIPARVSNRVDEAPHTCSETRQRCLRPIQLQSSVERSTEHNAVLCLVNARSVRNKTDELVDHINDNDIDIMVITETWLSHDASDHSHVAALAPHGYMIQHLPRPRGRGGGLAVVYRQDLTMEWMPPFKARSFECMDVKVSHGSACIRLVALYRPPPSTKNKLTPAMFFAEFTDLLEKYSSAAGNLLIAGDFNFHWGCADDVNAIELRNLLEAVGLTQHISEPTHENGRILDLLVTRSSENIVKKTTVSDLLSDHHAVHAQLGFTKAHQARKRVTFRKLQSIDQRQLHQDIMSSALTNTSNTSLDDLIQRYESVMCELLDKHAPLKTHMFFNKKKVPLVHGGD